MDNNLYQVIIASVEKDQEGPLVEVFAPYPMNRAEKVFIKAVQDITGLKEEPADAWVEHDWEDGDLMFMVDGLTVMVHKLPKKWFR